MYLNTMFHLSDASVKRRNLCQADVEVSVLHPAAHLTVSNSLFRARCDKASLVFSDSKLAAAMLYIQFEKNFIPDNVAVFDAFKAVTGYRIDSLQHAVAFVRAYHSRIHLRLNIAYPGRNDITDEEVLYSQSYPFHLGDTDGF